MTENKIRLVCATRHKRADFFSATALGRSLQISHGNLPFLELRIYAENSRGLPAVYNDQIRQAEGDPAILVFVHDDVHLVDFFWPDKVSSGLEQFDLIGVAGNTRRVGRQPAWHFVKLEAGKFTWDAHANLSGFVGHGKGFPCKVSRYGPAPRKCKLLDGVLLAARSDTLLRNGLLFDERFAFHFYDLDLCRQAEQKGMPVGTSPISLIHESGGRFGTAVWMDAYGRYLDKWGE